MKDHFLAFVQEANNRGHLARFFEGVSIQLAINTDKEVFYLSIQDGVIECRDHIDHESAVSITGEDKHISALLMGEIRLREAIDLGNLHVNTNFRTTLYLETLFLLSKPYEKISYAN
ncbi:SCP2 sterol-binding domain-containing protein [Cytobacillus sp. FJAT-54145]|uniref:SCP2 sterol-binding domain-containing protein n=1 Tax=Cytobacillus spartinae TaxID=3299023 RepID=A0ABW6KDK0_9BACI